MKYSQYFITKPREDGVYFTLLREDRPEELQDFVRAVHMKHFGGCLPNDWIYETISHAFNQLEENKLENCCIEADFYNSNLYKWLGEPFAQEYCNEVIQEDLIPKEKDIYSLISCAQYLAKERIYQAVNDFLKEEKHKELYRNAK